MTNTCERVESANMDVPLAEKLDSNWSAIEIVYALYNRGLTGPFADPTSYVVCPPRGMTVAEFLPKFIDGRLRGDPLPEECCRRRKHGEDPCTDPVEPIDIYLGVPCYVVIELHKDSGWQFRKGHPGITAKADYRSAGGESDNGDLWHATKDEPRAGAAGPLGDGCKLLYFSASQRDRFRHERFRLHLEGGVSLADPETIDPDIPNDGGKFPLIPISPCLGSGCHDPEDPVRVQD